MIYFFDYFNNSNIRILYNFLNTSFSNFSIINKHNRVKYIIDISYKVEFILLINILRTRFCNFQQLKTNMFHIN